MRAVVLVAALSAGLALGAPALAQDAAVLGELAVLQEKLTSNAGVIARDDGFAALDRLADWDLKPAQLQPAQRVQLLTVELYAALATGDARRARAALDGLRGEKVDPAQRERAAWLTAVAAGDAKAALEALEAGGASTAPDPGARSTDEGSPRDGASREGQRRERQKAWLARVGRKAPEAEIVAGDGTRLATARRMQIPLLIDFWNTRTPPEAAMVEALRAVHEAYKEELFFEMVSVNADDPLDTEKARRFAADAGYVWKTHFEGSAATAPITRRAFKIERPCQVLVDGRGYVRAVGRLTDPAFVYALRAAVAEARGDRAYLSPVTAGGEPSVPDAPTRGDEPSARGAGGKDPPKAAEPPSNPEAANKLTLARTYLRQKRRDAAKKLFEEIVRDYPGTKEAKEAAEYLEGLR